MDTNIILCGVGGQGILSIAYVLDNAALSEGWQFKQAEVHGMSQRGGAVQSHLRFSKGPVWSDLVPDGACDLILSVEPLEALRYVHTLRPGGWIVASSDPYVNIPNYPALGEVFERLAGFRVVLVAADELAKLAGSGRSSNMVMLGAGSLFLPFSEESCLAHVAALFAAKGDKVVGANQAAFRYGRALAQVAMAAGELGLEGDLVRRLLAVVDPRAVDLALLPAWVSAIRADAGRLDRAQGRAPMTAEGLKALQ